MNLVKKTFIIFLLAFTVQMLLLTGMVALGYTQSERTWKDIRMERAHDAAVAVLTSTDAEVMLPREIAMTVYNAQGILAASNRGTGRMRITQETDLQSVRIDGQVIGYYTTGTLSFRSDAANQEFIDTLLRMFLLGILASLAISLAAAVYFSRIVSRPAVSISQVLRRLAGGSLDEPVPRNGSPEIIAIADSALALRDRLIRERTLRSQWAQDIAHDLRTPVASLKAQLEGMADGVLSLDAGRLTRAVAECDRMHRLIDDLEQLIKLESPEMRIQPDTLDCASLAESLLERFQEAAEAKHISLSVSTETTVLRGDEPLVFRALSNIISNALRHTPPSGVVRLAFQQKDSVYRISVTNWGDVIPPEEQQLVFDRLYRGEFARRTSGSGLGLTIALRIAELHGGTITLSSSAHSGTCFSLELPV